MSIELERIINKPKGTKFAVKIKTGNSWTYYYTYKRTYNKKETKDVIRNQENEINQGRTQIG